MPLSGSQKETFYRHLKAPSRVEQHCSGWWPSVSIRTLKSIAGSGPLEDVIFDLIQWAESEDRTDDLIETAQASQAKQSRTGGIHQHARTTGSSPGFCYC